MRNKSFVLILSSFLVIAAIYLGTQYNKFKSEGSMSLDPTPTPIQAQIVSPPSVNQENRKEFTLEAGSYYYKPNVISVKKGDFVIVTINSVDMLHDFVIDELNVKSEKALSSKSVTVEFIADAVGEFEFYCSVGNHRVQGMIGTLIITE